MSDRTPADMYREWWLTQRARAMEAESEVDRLRATVDRVAKVESDYEHAAYSFGRASAPQMVVDLLRDLRAARGEDQ